MRVEVILQKCSLAEMVLVQPALLYLLTQLLQGSQNVAVSVPEDSKLVIEAKVVVPEADWLHVGFLVRHVCSLGSFAVHFVYNRERGPTLPTLYIPGGNELDSYKLFDAVFGQALEKLVSI